MFCIGEGRFKCVSGYIAVRYSIVMLLFFAESLLSLECVNMYTVEVKRGVKCIPGIESTIAGEHATIGTITKWKAFTDERKILLLITYIMILCAK